MSEVLVSVLCITYNQVDYVEDMLNGIVKQKTNFKYEVIVHDDASTDGTVDILKEYQNKYSDLLNVIYENENQWSRGVKITQKIMVPLIKGKYVAFCEGDDFWIDHNKLQEQVDFLEKNPDYVCVAHNALCWEEGKLYPMDNFEQSREILDREILDRKFPFLATAGKVYRKETFILDDFFLECGEVGDMCTEYAALLKGKFYYMDKIMSVYRYRSKGSWSNRVRKSDYNLIFRAKFIRFLSKYNDYTNGQYKDCLENFASRGVAYLCAQLVREKISAREFNDRLDLINMQTDYIYDKWLKQIEFIVKLKVYSVDESFDQIIKNLSKDRDIYIYGAGDYATKMADQMMNHNIRFDGFVVSSLKNNPSKKMGKCVHEITELSSKSKNTFIIVAVDAINWNEIKLSIENCGIQSYYCPFYVSF